MLFYRAFPYAGELEDIVDWFIDGSVLELGCGTGRLCARLVECGHTVTGVDNSPEMLKLLPSGVRGIETDIESLRLDEQFANVVLASNLINHPVLDVRRAFVSAAYRHLLPGGRCFFQRCDPEWLASVKQGNRSEIRDVSMLIEAVTRQDDHVSISIMYVRGSDQWRHHFTMESLSEVQINTLLLDAGFVAPKWLGRRNTWVLVERD